MTTVAHDDWVILGRFGRVHGLKGAISIVSFTNPRENILDYHDWYIQKQGQWQLIEREKDEITEKHLLTWISGLESREDVASLTNFEIAVPKSMLPELDTGEYYWNELIGMTVVHEDGTVFGPVLELIETGSNDVLIVQGEQRYLIPYLFGEVVLAVDKNKKQITVRWDLDY